MFKGSSKAALHTKAYVVDRSVVLIGSFNLDPRSQLNTELLLTIHSPELAQQVAAMFEKAIVPERSFRISKDAQGKLEWDASVDGRPVQYHDDPMAGFWRNVLSGVVSVLPVDEHL
jgi:putative cardiolipin synthase